MLLSQIISKDIEISRKDENRYVALCPWHKDTKPSLQIHNSKNLYKCFVCGKGGKGAISWIMDSRNLNRKQAIDLLKENYEKIDFKNYNDIKENITYLLPLNRFKKPSFEHYLYGLPTNIYEYRNLEGRLIGYTARYIQENGEKIILPYTYILVNNSEEWVFKRFENPSLPYKAELLKNNNLPVCIVEGEKAADMGNKSTKNFIFISWIGGANNVNYIDWSVLKGKNVILIPDHDKLAKDSSGNLLPIEKRPGNKAMLNIANFIIRIASSIEFIKIPEEYPNKWDIADRIWKQGDIQYWIKKHKQNFFKLKL